MITSVTTTQFTHGTSTAYFRRGCRCDDCKAAGKEFRTHKRSDIRLPFGPLDAIIKSRGITWYEFGGVSSERLREWRAKGIPLLSADGLACRLGHHPSEIWNEWDR